ncbi:MAG: hypothetical protein ARM1_0159 [Candidatus Micrarchaeota archaeon]|nr:MAG: hypothetical protein ARM1_0159 [Candidatus Micrarchaeota archaeon]
MNSKIVAAGIIVVLIVAVIAYIALSSKHTYTVVTPSTNSSSSIPPLAAGYVNSSILLTDPPIVPNGTTSLTINYSKILVIYSKSKTNTTQNSVYINQSSTLNLLNLTNASIVAGKLSIPNGSYIRKIIFFVNRANATINGTSYRVVVATFYNNTQNSIVSANINRSLNSSFSNLLIDLSPTLVELFTSNSSATLVLVPSVRSIVVPGKVTVRVGARVALNSTEKKELDDLRGSIAIESARFYTLNNSSVVLYINVKNTGNKTIYLKHVIVNGKFVGGIIPFGIITPYPVAIRGEIKANNDMMPSSIPYYNINGYGYGNIYNMTSLSSNISSNLNISGLSSKLNISLSANASDIEKEVLSKLDDIEKLARMATNESELDVEASAYISLANNSTVTRAVKSNLTAILNLERLRSINFLVNSSGALQLPFDYRGEGEEEGYMLAPGANVTLVFKGFISLYQPESELEGINRSAITTCYAKLNANSSIANGSVVVRCLPIIRRLPPAFILHPVNNSCYNIRVIGTEDTLANLSIKLTHSQNNSC